MNTGLRYLDSVDEFNPTISTTLAGQASLSDHSGRECVIHSCGFRFTRSRDYQPHLRAVHQDVFTCDECMYVGKSQYEVALHASNTGHASFSCNHDGCGKRFSRLDTYQRHERTHREDAKRFPCRYCKKYRGPKGFKRKDHLTQHIRNYHHIGEDEEVGKMFDRKWCPKQECTDSKPDSMPHWDRGGKGTFASSKEWIKHIRTVHDESEFSCPQPGCDRVNGKGYFCQNDLRAHLRKVHGTDGSFDMSLRNDWSA
jgi:hypothetical protein